MICDKCGQDVTTRTHSDCPPMPNNTLIDEARAFCFKSDAPIWEVTHEEAHQLMAAFAASQIETATAEAVRKREVEIANRLERIIAKRGFVDTPIQEFIAELQENKQP